MIRGDSFDNHNTIFVKKSKYKMVQYTTVLSHLRILYDVIKEMKTWWNYFWGQAIFLPIMHVVVLRAIPEYSSAVEFPKPYRVISACGMTLISRI